MSAKHRVRWSACGARLAAAAWLACVTAAMPACVCVPTDGQECDDDRPEELYLADGYVTINGARAPGIWIVTSRGDSVRSGFNGDFAFELPLTGTSITARAPAGTAFVRETHSVGIVDRTGLHFEGYRLASISGHVRSRGQPVQAILQISGLVTRVDTAGPDGAYAFTELPSLPIVGHALELIGGPPGITTRRLGNYPLLGQDVVVDIEASFIAGGHITGHVRAGTSGIANVIVTVAGLLTVVDTTDANGRYDASDIPLGDFTVSISGYDASAYAFNETSRVVAVVGRGTVVDFDATAIRPNLPPSVVITQPTEGATFQEGTPIQLAGSALDPEDGPLTGASLVWTAGSGTALGTGASLTTSTLTDGPHRIWLTATDAQGLSGTASVLISVAPAPATGSISGRVTANGGGIGDVLVRLSGPVNSAAVTNATASYTFSNLPPGTYTVTISGFPSAVSFPSTSQTVTLAGGQNLVVDFAGTY